MQLIIQLRYCTVQLEGVLFYKSFISYIEQYDIILSIDCNLENEKFEILFNFLFSVIGIGITPAGGESLIKTRLFPTTDFIFSFS